jgi:hypothetical protein
MVELQLPRASISGLRLRRRSLHTGPRYGMVKSPYFVFGNERKAILKPKIRVGSCRNDLRDFPEPVQDHMGYALYIAQRGGKHRDTKTLSGFGGGGGWSDEKDRIVVDHAVEYVRGEVHTNGLENFGSLVKRGLNGTYISVEPFHLFRYLDEQAFRYNNRKMDDGDRFDIIVR